MSKKTIIPQIDLDKMIDACNRVGEIVCAAYPDLDGAVVEVSETAEDYYKDPTYSRSVEAFAEHKAASYIEDRVRKMKGTLADCVTFEPDNGLSLFEATTRGLLVFDGITRKASKGVPHSYALHEEIRGILAEALAMARCRAGYRVTREPVDITKM